MLNVPPGINATLLSFRNLLQFELFALKAVSPFPVWYQPVLLPPSFPVRLEVPVLGVLPILAMLHCLFPSIDLAVEYGDLADGLFSFFIRFRVPDIKRTL